MWLYRFIVKNIYNATPVILIMLEIVVCSWWYTLHPLGKSALLASEKSYVHQKSLLDKAINKNIYLKAAWADLKQFPWYLEKIMREELQMGYSDEKVYMLK